MHRSSLDWEKIERDYRAGLLSVREIGRQHGCSGVAIAKRAKRDGWHRDLTAKVQQRVRVKIGLHSVASEQVFENENQIVEEASERAARVVEGHLARAQRLTRLVDRALAEMEAHFGDDDERAQRAAALLFPTKGDSLTSHLRATGMLIERVARLERQALNLDVEQGIDHEQEVTTLAERLLKAQREMEAATVVHPEQADAALDADEISSGAAGVPDEPA